MKKIILVIFLLTALTFTSLKAENGVGIQFGYPTNVALTYRSGHFPVIGVGWDFRENGFLAVTLDYWMIDNKVAKDLKWYLGPGANIFIPFSSGSDFGIGLRLPVGLRWLPSRQWEIFGELAPTLNFIPALDFDLHVAVGVRYLF